MRPSCAEKHPRRMSAARVSVFGIFRIRRLLPELLELDVLELNLHGEAFVELEGETAFL